MIQRIQSLPRGQRILIFTLFFGGGLMGIAALTAFLLLLSINSEPRQEANAMMEGVTIREFAQLPDDNSYPAAIASAVDGTLYTASYDTGVVWQISQAGEVTELPETRERIGSVTGLTVAADGTLYILDRINSNPRAAGGILWRLRDDVLHEFAVQLDGTTDFVSPDDVETDPAGNIYVTDRGRREVWRFAPEGASALWWMIPPETERADEMIPTGLAYDAAHDAMIITESETGAIFRVSLVDNTTEQIYQFEGAGSKQPGFDGVTVGAEGQVYAAAFANHRVVWITDGVMEYLAADFRGASDVTYYDNRIYVTNFDSRSLVLPGIEPQLPFGIDVLTLP